MQSGDLEEELGTIYLGMVGQLSRAIKTRVRTEIIRGFQNWPTLGIYANRGIRVKIDLHEISVGVSSSLQERQRLFTQAIIKYVE